METTGKTGGTGTDLYVYQKDYLRPMRPVLSKTGYPRDWDCRGHNASVIECPSPLLLESDIEEAFIRLSDKLWRYRHSLLEETVKLLETMQHSNQPIRVG